MTPRYVPPTLEEQGIEVVFQRRHLNLDLFKLLAGGTKDNTAIADILSKEYYDRMGIEIHIAAKTIKRYRTLL